MATTHRLIAHSRNVDVFEESVGKHTGYDLIAYEGDNIKSVQSFDLSITDGDIEI